MRVLVTGGAGFIGSHIVDVLRSEGHECFVVDDLSSGSPDNLPADVPLFEVDIRDAARLREVFDEARPDWVSHQAAQMSVSRSVREPGFDAEVNVMGLLNVLGESQRCGVQRVTFASSGGVLYGDVESPADENHPADPISPYGISKWVGERYLQFYARDYGLKSVALRYANVYGPRQNPHGEAGVVAIFCTKMLQGEPATVNGDGKYIRDYVYCKDVARANLAALQSESDTGFRAYNVGTSVPTDVNELAASLRNACGAVLEETGSETRVPEPLHGPPRAGDLRSSLVSYSKAEQELEWKPEVALDAGIAQTVRWFQDKLKAAK
ncbi:UDP-glucose 4-epimerase [Maioricimonas rarisocia]|uniref:UDP-glucose 4-epimerase n=1 Tax=Maioricimonas rarisocia TaxID=2528026 RepID=A0A517ZFW0_9PLAN|nr:NAD-dependent epimerase/dehydratase family protein [Maioricimonas rarisocia]QDU41351.1 UDP-glucose 4-epimerase [Maioricimonas rarisocia]